MHSYISIFLVNIGGPSRKNVAQAALATTFVEEGGRVKPSRRVEVPAPASGAIGCYAHSPHIPQTMQGKDGVCLKLKS